MSDSASTATNMTQFEAVVKIHWLGRLSTGTCITTVVNTRTLEFKRNIAAKENGLNLRYCIRIQFGRLFINLMTSLKRC